MTALNLAYSCKQVFIIVLGSSHSRLTEIPRAGKLIMKSLLHQDDSQSGYESSSYAFIVITHFSIQRR